jgi:oligopeptidase B
MTAPSASTVALTAPVTPQTKLLIEQLGRTRVDEYAWLKAPNWREVMHNPAALPSDIRSHLESENAYTAAMLSDTDRLQRVMVEEMKGRIKDDDASAPEPDGVWSYYSRYAPGAQHPIYARQPRGGGSEQILLNADTLAKGTDYFDTADIGHSPNHRYFGYAVDTQGSEYYTVHIRDLETGQDLPNVIANCAGDFIFSPDSQYIFWVWRDENARSARIYRRPVAGGPSDDVLVYAEKDPGFFINVEVTEDERYILLQANGHTSSEIRLIPGNNPTAKPLLVAAREPGVEYSMTHWNEQFFILTNAGGATDFKIMVTAEKAPERVNWQEWLPHEPGRYIMGMMAFENHLVRLERVNALNRIVVHDRKTDKEWAIGAEEEAYSFSLAPGLEYATNTMRFVYQSPTTPRQWFDYDMSTRERHIVKSQEVPSGHRPADYVTKRITARSADGAEVPVTLLMKKGTKLDGTNPVLLYGYGSYGHTMEADFSTARFSLVDRGFIWAIAHIRGGADKGYGWYLDGKLEKKTNTFKDFIAVADTLVAQGYTQKGKIVAYGGSAGGMLMGAVANMRPDLWAGVIGAVPFVDVLNTMSDKDLPLTPPEWPEWGNPIEDAHAYDVMAAYSPYDNIKAQAYPAILATGGLSDPRVTYWEPTKWVARLRANTTSNNPVLLKINMTAGHGGNSGRYDYLKDIALNYAFAVWAVKRTEP